MNTKPSRLRQRLLFVLFMLLVAGGVIAAYTQRESIARLFNGQKAHDVNATRTPLNVQLVNDRPHTLYVPEEVRASLGIRKAGKDIVALAELPKFNRPLVLSASTRFIPGGIARIRTRFTPADVVMIPKIAPFGIGDTRVRELGPGDEVKAGMVLAELYSVDLGAKKNELIDALVQWKNHKELLDNARSSIAVPRALILTYETAVQSDINAIGKAESYLRGWQVPKEEIDEVHQAAEQIFKDSKKDDKDFKRFKSNWSDKWGKIVLKAPFDAKIVECNISEKETLNDSTVNLFQLAKVDELQVLANAPEEKVEELYHVWKDSGLWWTIRPLGKPNSDGILCPIKEIGYLADPNTHTIPIKGVLPNPDNNLRAGQYVTATIQLPAPTDVVEIPASALVDDGKQTVVFVQLDEKKPEYTLRRVLVTYRNEYKVCVRSVLSENERKPTPEEQELGMMPREELHVGDRVLTAGLLELKKELEDRQADKVD